MSADIVERLRQYEGDMSQTTMCYNGEEAAAEIEALRSRVAELGHECDMMRADFNDCNTERARWRDRAEAAEAVLAKAEAELVALKGGAQP